MSFSRAVEGLEKEIDMFQCRPSSLPGDIVLLGLARDVYDTVIAVAHTLTTELPHKAYANARLVFEAAQSALVLATHEDFVRAGALAWTYYENVTALSQAMARQSGSSTLEDAQLAILDRRVNDFASGWETVRAGSSAILQDAKRETWSKRKAKPDNWLHEALDARQLRGYTLFATVSGGTAPAPQDLADLNKAMYRVLCHETHAHPRMHSFRFRRMDDGLIEVLSEDRDAEGSRRSIASCVEMAVEETATSLRWQRTNRATA
jgi:hypothetical protein